MMLEIARFWSSIAHYNPERDRYEIHGVMGPDEFHEKYPDADRGRAAQQRLHERHGRLDLSDRARGARPAAGQPARGVTSTNQAHRRGARTLAGDEPQDVRALPRRRRHQSVRRATRSWRNSTGRATARATGTSSASTGSCAPRATPRPLQGEQAGGHGDALLPVLPARAARAVRRARLRVHARHCSQDDRLLRPPHLPRLDAQPCHPRAACWPRSIPNRRGNASSSPWRATSMICSAAPPKRGSISA